MVLPRFCGERGSVVTLAWVIQLGDKLGRFHVEANRTDVRFTLSRVFGYKKDISLSHPRSADGSIIRCQRPFLPFGNIDSFESWHICQQYCLHISFQMSHNSPVWRSHLLHIFIIHNYLMTNFVCILLNLEKFIFYFIGKIYQFPFQYHAYIRTHSLQMSCALIQLLILDHPPFTHFSSTW